MLYILNTTVLPEDILVSMLYPTHYVSSTNTVCSDSWYLKTDYINHPICIILTNPIQEKIASVHGFMHVEIQPQDQQMHSWLMNMAPTNKKILPLCGFPLIISE